jgi:RNA polymerase sigma-70 factor (ECF subfamily)
MSDAARSALETAVRRLSPQLVAALGRRVGPGRLDLAEDAVQFAMLQAARTWGFHGAPDQPRAWLLRVARTWTSKNSISFWTRTSTTRSLPSAMTTAI